MIEPASKAPRRSRLRLALAIAGVALTVVALLLYATRRIIARDTLTAWLRSKGVAASAEVRGLGLNDVTGSLSVGDPRQPDFSVERVEVGYGVRGLNLEVRSVRLVRPALKASWRGGRFSAGALDRLIAEFQKAPPHPGAAQPKIIVEDGRLLLATDYGELHVEGDGTVSDGRLQRLAARTAPAVLRGRNFQASLGPAALSAQAAGPRLELSLDAPVAEATAGPLGAQSARLRLTAAGPYPDLQRRREDGAVVAHAELSGGRLAYASEALRNGLISAALTGQASGGIRDFALAGGAVADLRAGGTEAAGGTGGPLRATASAAQLRWTRQGGERLSAQLAVDASLDSFAQKDVRLAQVKLVARGPVSIAAGRGAFDLAISAAGHGGWMGLGAPTAADAAEIAAAKRAARGFRFAAPAVVVRSAGGTLGGRIVRPVRVLPGSGGVVTLAPVAGGWRLTAAGGGLPKLDADIRSLALAPGGAIARGRIQAALSLGLIQDGRIDASGALRLANGALSFIADRCAEVAARRLDFGMNDAEQFSARLCPAGGPLIALGHGDWRIAGRAQDVAAEVPFLQARIARAAGVVDLAGIGSALQTQMRLDSAHVIDAAHETRFRPVVVVGGVRLANHLWASSLLIHDRAGRPLAEIRLRHDDRSGRGDMDIETGLLRFTQGGLQPAELSPIAAMIGAPAEGEARFSGAISWTAEATTSSGVLEVPRLDFQSPAGKVTGLTGRVAFDSLAPLTAAPGQVLQAQAIAAPTAPLARPKAVFGLTPSAIVVSQAQAAVDGGSARIEGLDIPLDSSKPIRGVVDLEGVQLHDFVKASPFGDRVDLDAKVSGRVPFTVQGEKVRVSGGSLHAVQPGRLSIQRAALAGVAASGAVSAPGAPGAAAPEASTDTFSDFAYQAMENLAFTTLTATVDSRSDGRLGVVFHIVGQHDPPQHQEIRIPMFDLIRKKFLGKKLPLPSGTGVDLTLDTTLNLDDLLGDYAEFRRLHGSAQVQP